MLKVFLYGKLGEAVGKEWELDVSTISEVFSAIDANTEKLYSFILDKENIKNKYSLHFENEKPITYGELGIKINSKKELHIVPVIKGDGKIGKVLKVAWESESTEYGLWALVVGFVAGGIADYAGGQGWEGTSAFFEGLSDISYEVGVALLIQGVVSALQDEPEHPEVSGSPDPASSSSYIFNSPTNNVTQGVYVPVGYGRLRVGSSVISSSLLNSDLVKLEDDWNHSSVEEEIGSGGKYTRSQETAQHIDMIY